ncbi:MAG TPA: hypothetical protein VH518_06070 [Tepidisphaeraceae bacterium]
MSSVRGVRLVCPILVLCAMGTGCVSTVSTMTPGKMEWVQANSDAPRAGNAYCIRGLIGLFSGGMDQLTEKIDQAGIRAHVFQEDQHEVMAKQFADVYSKYKQDHEPIVLIGHSLGADDAIYIARALDEVNVPVDVLVTIDATRPPKVPKNVKIVYNYYQPSVFDGTGILRGIPLETDPGFTGQLNNMNVRAEYSYLLEWDTNHVNIDKNTKIHADVIQKLMPICVPRAQWAATHHTPILAGSTTRPVSNNAGTEKKAEATPLPVGGSSEAMTSPALAR